MIVKINYYFNFDYFNCFLMNFIHIYELIYLIPNIKLLFLITNNNKNILIFMIVRFL
jgi:hypothetical protein